MNLLQEIEQIPMINDHTHIFGCGVPTYEEAGRSAIFDTPEDVLIGLSSMNMNETVFLGKEPQEVRKLLLQLYDGRKTTYPVRAFVRMLHKYFGFEDQEVTLENAPELIRRIREKFPEDTEGYYKCLGELSNTEVYLCNHGEVENYDERTTQGRFRWVPYIQLNSDKLNEISQGFGLPTPTTLEEMEDVVQRYIHVAKAGGAVAIKGGAFAYVLDRPFAPDPENLNKAEQTKKRLDAGKGDKQDSVIVEDALSVLCARAAGREGIPVQIHAGLIWTAWGPTRIPLVKELSPFIYSVPETTFVLFHGGFPHPDDLAHLAATMTNVRAELNWMPYWAGERFAEVIGQWIDMIPNDRMLYGTDSAGLSCLTHDMVTREGLAQALEVRVSRGGLSKPAALQIAANLLRNNAIDVYSLSLPKYVV